MPYDPPSPYRPLPAEITSQRERRLRYPGKWLEEHPEEVQAADRQALVALYDGEIAYVDRLVGQVLDELESQGLADQTVIILNADHGEEFADHGRYGHCCESVYDELVRVPFIVSGPGVGEPGRRVETRVRLLDLVPTVCEIAGVPTPGEAEGRSLVPFLRGDEMEELPAFSELPLKMAVHYGDYKLIYSTDDEGQDESIELYDVEADPRELVNLADQEPEIVERMWGDLRAWRERSNQVATELPVAGTMNEDIEEEMRQRLRDAGY
jgi:arylsulfatase A-like enzyme